MKPIYVKEKGRWATGKDYCMGFTVRFDESKKTKTLYVKSENNAPPFYFHFESEPEALVQEDSWLFSLLKTVYQAGEYNPAHEQQKEFKLIEEGNEYCYVQIGLPDLSAEESQTTELVQVQQPPNPTLTQTIPAPVTAPVDYSIKPILIEEGVRWQRSTNQWIKVGEEWVQCKEEYFMDFKVKQKAEEAFRNLVIKTSKDYATVLSYSIDQNPEQNYEEDSWVGALVKALSEKGTYTFGQYREFELKNDGSSDLYDLTDNYIQNQLRQKQQQDTEQLQAASKKKSSFCTNMMILGGFIAVLGALTVALTLTLLLPGIGGILGAVVGATAFLGGVGFFGLAFDMNSKEKKVAESLNPIAISI